MRNETKISKVGPRDAIYGQTRQHISKTYGEARKLISVFDCSHIELHLKKYKLKFTFAERNQNIPRLTPGIYLWTSSSNYLENSQRGAKIEFGF